MLYGNRITGKLEELGFIWARNKIRSFMGQIADCGTQSAILRSQNVSEITKYFFNSKNFSFIVYFFA
jgi:hypothetical protein